jgi:hypothetical protein
MVLDFCGFDFELISQTLNSYPCSLNGSLFGEVDRTGNNIELDDDDEFDCVSKRQKTSTSSSNNDSDSNDSGQSSDSESENSSS